MQKGKDSYRMGRTEGHIVDTNSSIKPDKTMRLPTIINAFLRESLPANNMTTICNALRMPKEKQSGTTNRVMEEKTNMFTSAPTGRSRMSVPSSNGPSSRHHITIWLTKARQNMLTPIQNSHGISCSQPIIVHTIDPNGIIDSIEHIRMLANVPNLKEESFSPPGGPTPNSSEYHPVLLQEKVNLSNTVPTEEHKDSTLPLQTPSAPRSRSIPAKKATSKKPAISSTIPIWLISIWVSYSMFTLIFKRGKPGFN